jgi:hypothetical protein
MVDLHGAHTGQWRATITKSDLHYLEHPIIWNIWKERCRKVFDNRAMQAHHLLQELINDDVKQWFLAWKSSAELTE